MSKDSDIMVPKYAYAMIDGLLPAVQLLLDFQMLSMSGSPEAPDMDLKLDGNLGLKLVAMDETNTCFRLDLVLSVYYNASGDLVVVRDGDGGEDCNDSFEKSNTYDISLPLNLNVLALLGLDEFLPISLDTIEIYSTTGHLLGSNSFEPVYDFDYLWHLIQNQTTIQNRNIG